MQVLRVNLGQKSYDILIGKGILSKLPSKISELSLSNYKPVILSNNTILKLYEGKLYETLSKIHKDIGLIRVPDSEESKSWQVFHKVLKRLVTLDRGRGVYLIAFGGGVIGDLTGFLAAVYKRGIPYIQIPTTLLSQVDSAIGGKVAIDLEFGKNLVGAFYQPKLVLSDLNFLLTLPKGEILNGLSEVIKYGIIRSRQLFRGLEEKPTDTSSWNIEDWGQIVVECASIKARVVERDEYDRKDIRIILNFGHTIGHALEAGSEYKIPHGEAVGFGMVVESLISNRLGLLKEKELKRIIELILKFGCVQGLRRGEISILEITKHLPYDKKARFGRMRFVLPTRIGATKVLEGIDSKVIRECIREGIRLCLR
jgi:3-dehydroquinate synthase